MKRYPRAVRVLGVACVSVFLAGFAEVVQDKMETKYPEPRYPSYFQEPTSVEQVMPYVRRIVRNKSGIQGGGMGNLEEGDSVLLVVGDEAEEIILQALTKAAQERGITVDIKSTYAMQGLTPEEEKEFLELRGARRDYTAEKGFEEGADWWQGRIYDNAGKKWLKANDGELYATVFGERDSQQVPARLKELRAKMQPVGDGIKAYLTAHPDFRGVFWGTGGTTALRRALYPLQDKYLGTMWMDNRWQVMSEIGAYPADVWQLTEEQTLEPLAYVERMEVTDPEGTNVWCDFSELQSDRWAQGAYQRGHLYMFPNQATGRFGYSVVDYPAFQKQWLPREPIARLEGVIAGTKGHTGFMPRWEVHFKNGFISEVKGGGKYGDLLRDALKYPPAKDLQYPFHDEKGFWYLYEIAWGTHPKFFRHPGAMMNGSLGPERLAAGVYHWGLGARLRHDPSAPIDSPAWNEFARKEGAPVDHGFHTHTYFNTYKVRIRGADRWVTLEDKGRMTSLDDAEVRALASRYGDADRILAQEWIDEIPGINAPGDYMKDYAPNPWKTAKKVVDGAKAGTYEHLWP